MLGVIGFRKSLELWSILFSGKVPASNSTVKFTGTVKTLNAIYELHKHQSNPWAQLCIFEKVWPQKPEKLSKLILFAFNFCSCPSYTCICRILTCFLTIVYSENCPVWTFYVMLIDSSYFSQVEPDLANHTLNTNYLLHWYFTS